MTAWHNAGFTFHDNIVFDKSVLLRRHTAFENCTGSERDRAKPERLLQNDALETVAKIIDSSDFDVDEKLYFIHTAAGRAINTDLYERRRLAEKKIQEKNNPSALEHKLAAGITDTGVMDDEDYAREEAGVQDLAAQDREGMKFQCSVCNKMYKKLLGCQKHDNAKHPPAMNFRVVDLIQQEDDAAAVDLMGQRRNGSGQFAVASLPASNFSSSAAQQPPSPAASLVSTPLRGAPRTPLRGAPRFNPEMLAFLQDQLRQSPRNAEVASTPPNKPKAKRRKRCGVCNDLYDSYAQHVLASSKHQKVRDKEDGEKQNDEFEL